MNLALKPLLILAVGMIHVSGSSAREISTETAGDATTTVTGTTVENGDASVREYHWRQRKSCGVSCTYCLLRYLGLRVSFKEVEKQIPIGRSGSSLADMQRACQAFGVSTNVVRMSAGAFDAELPPAVAHLAPENALSAKYGHYVLVTLIDEHSVFVIDPTYANVQAIPRGDFLRAWSGILLVPVRSWAATRWFGAIVLALQVTAIISLTITGGKWHLSS